MADVVPSPVLTRCYTASWHAVVAFVESIHRQLKLIDSPIHPSLVCPRPVDTLMLSDARLDRCTLHVSVTSQLVAPDDVAASTIIAIDQRRADPAERHFTGSPSRLASSSWRARAGSTVSALRRTL